MFGWILISLIFAIMALMFFIQGKWTPAFLAQICLFLTGIAHGLEKIIELLENFLRG